MTNRLPHLLLAVTLLMMTGAARQGQSLRIGEIEFFGRGTINLGKILAALPVKEGDPFDPETWPEEKNRVRQAIKSAGGGDPTDVAATCCDARGGVIIYIGLSGKPVRYLPTPKGSTELPVSVIHLHDQTESLLEEAVRNGAAAEERSKGYSLSAYPPLRAAQLRMRTYALRHERLLRAVLKTSSDSKQRAVAAELLGYARRSASQVTALTAASRDANEGVRNNATRALVVLAESYPSLARHIPPESFIEMVLSGTWTDVNKAGALLADLTKVREPALLAKLRRPEVLRRLVEIARWQTEHANAARYILGRVAGIEERRLDELVATKRVDVIVEALGITGSPR